MSEERAPLHVNDLIVFSLDQFASVAWQKLGLQPDPITNEVAMDLDQAKTAIDIASKLAEQIESSLDEEDKRRIRNLISDLRMNYVGKSEQAAGD